MKLPKQKIGDLFEVQLGKMLNENARVGELFPYLANFNVRWGKFDLSDLNRMAFSETERKKFTIQKNDLLMCEGGEIGRCAVWTGSDTDIYFQKAIHRLRPRDERVSSYFMYYFMQNISTKGDLPKLVGETSIAHLTREKLVSLAIPVPPRAVQDRIVEVLLAWDAAIDKTEQLLAAKQQRNKALSNQLLFGHVRFGAHDTQTTQSIHWFSAPKDWQVVKIGQIANEASTLNVDGESLPVLSCTKYDGLVDSLKYFDKQVFSHNTSKYKVVKRGQFAYATNHIEEGSIGYQNLVPAGLVSPIYTVFQIDTSKIDDGYLYKLLKTERLRQIFAANTNASVDRRGSLRWKEFARIQIPLPALSEQKEINAVLDEAKREISLLKAELEALKTQKRGLMQKLLTGQWRVKLPETESA